MFVQTSAAREYQLCQVLQEAKQEDRSIQDFYLLLSGYWKELQTMEVPLPDSMSAILSFKTREIAESVPLCHMTMN